LVNAVWLPIIRATIELRRNNAARAIDILEGAKRYEANAVFWPQYVRGQAYLKLGTGAEAAAEFQKILDHRGGIPLPICIRSRTSVWRGRQSLTGDTAKARQACQDFFALWKDADPDLPALIEAKKEYEKLK